MVATWPDIAVVPLLLILGAVALVLPVVVYPVSYTVWQAVDLAMHPPEPGDGAPPPADRTCARGCWTNLCSLVTLVSFAATRWPTPTPPDLTVTPLP